MTAKPTPSKRTQVFFKYINIPTYVYNKSIRIHNLRGRRCINVEKMTLEN